MSNKRKIKKPWLRLKGAGLKLPGQRVTIPDEEKVVIGTVPAVIHWSEWDHNDRTDDETIGQTVVYDDGSFDMVIDRDISEEAKSVANYMQQTAVGSRFSLAKEE